MSAIPKCPTCGRRPSERGHFNPLLRSMSHCPGALHDAADLGPAAVALLREWDAAGEYLAWEQRVTALLAAAPEVKP